MAKRKVTVQDAAEALGISVDAVRQRIRRGKLARAAAPDDEPDKRVYVWLGLDETVNEEGSSRGLHGADDELLEAYRDQVAFLRREIERKDAIILTMAQRIPELEPPREPRYAPETPADEPEGLRERPPTEEAQEATERPSWWRRWFGFE